MITMSQSQPFHDFFSLDPSSVQPLVSESEPITSSNLAVVDVPTGYSTPSIDLSCAQGGQGNHKRSRSSINEYSIEDTTPDFDDKPRKRGRPPKVRNPEDPQQQQHQNLKDPQPIQRGINSTSTSTTAPNSPASQKPSTTGNRSGSGLRALPSMRDHTTNQVNPEGDEYIPREIDEAGETKVDKDGVLQHQRMYRCRTFRLPHRANKLFMLATECARVLSYRDSYLLFTKNQSLYKIIASQAEKDSLIAQEILPYSYRSRQIAIVAARSIFRQFGSRIIVNGHRVRDDYWESRARKQGFTENDVASDRRPGVNRKRETTGVPLNFNMTTTAAGALAPACSPNSTFSTMIDTYNPESSIFVNIPPTLAPASSTHAQDLSPTPTYSFGDSLQAHPQSAYQIPPHEHHPHFQLHHEATFHHHPENDPSLIQNQVMHHPNYLDVASNYIIQNSQPKQSSIDIPMDEMGQNLLTQQALPYMQSENLGYSSTMNLSSPSNLTGGTLHGRIANDHINEMDSISQVLPLSHSSLTSCDFLSLTRPRLDFAGPPYLDQTIPSPTSEILSQASQMADFNRNLSEQRFRRSQHLSDLWKRPLECATMLTSSQPTDLSLTELKQEDEKQSAQGTPETNFNVWTGNRY